jgi:uncharacterized coiled-coil protein SlyX
MKKIDLLEALIEALINRLMVAKVIGKNNDIVAQQDKVIDAIKAELEKVL